MYFSCNIQWIWCWYQHKLTNFSTHCWYGLTTQQEEEQPEADPDDEDLVEKAEKEFWDIIQNEKAQREKKAAQLAQLEGKVSSLNR